MPLCSWGLRGGVCSVIVTIGSWSKEAIDEVFSEYSLFRKGILSLFNFLCVLALDKVSFVRHGFIHSPRRTSASKWSSTRTFWFHVSGNMAHLLTGALRRTKKSCAGPKILKICEASWTQTQKLDLETAFYRSTFLETPWLLRTKPKPKPPKLGKKRGPILPIIITKQTI